MEKTAKRISSIFSTGSAASAASGASDKSSSTLYSIPSSHASQSSRGSSPPRKPLPSNSKLRPLSTSTSNQQLRGRDSPPQVPLFGPTLSPPLTGDDDNGHTPIDMLKPLPQRVASPNGSATNRPGSRPGSRPASPSKGFLRPLTPASESSRPNSRAGSRPGSRTSSPHKDFHRPFTPTSDTSRPMSRGNRETESRPASPSKPFLSSPTAQREQKLAKRKSWLPGKSRTDTPPGETRLPDAWIAAPSNSDKKTYKLDSLVNFQKVDELWNDSGDAIVYLHTKEAYRGPSFRVDSSIFAASRKLTALAHGPHTRNAPVQRPLEEQTQRMTLQPPESRSRPGSSVDSSSQGSRTFSDSFDDMPLKDVSLYLPLPLQAELASAGSQLGAEDIEQLVAVRNVFAFLSNRPLVATSKTPTVFGIFLKIADFLQRYNFSNLDGSTLGEESASNFKEYVDYFKLADVRTSREKTMEAIILGERMRSWTLYTEGFVHGVGKYDAIVGLKSPKYHMITDVTAKRLERATLDLVSNSQCIL